ncbi:MAG TPA: hypothetical protein VIV60_27835, partial [Polyangiaceae bacterium]
MSRALEHTFTSPRAVTRWMKTPSLLSLVVAMVGACASDGSDESIGVTAKALATGLVLNEVLFNPNGDTGADAAYQYVEIKGSAGGTLENVYLVYVNGQAATTGSSAGRVLGVVSLNAATIGTNGTLVVTPGAGGFTFPVGTTRVDGNYTMPNTTGISDDDLSILLVQSTTAITTATDFDPANNGTFTLPSGVTLIDAIG